MKTHALLLCIITTLGTMLQGQSRRLFIGIQPDVTMEIQHNDEKAYSINVLPLVGQVYLNDFTSVRLSSTLNLQNTTRSISQVGGQLGVPVYIFGKNQGAVQGIYAAPIFGFSHNRESASNEITLALEPGYSWVLSRGFTMNLGLQLGGTYFTLEGPEGGWRNHAGIKFSLGYTFRSE